MAGVAGVLDELPAQIAILKVPLRIERMDNPHLVPAPARRYVEALFKELLIAHAQRTPLAGIHHGNKDYVALVSLKLGRISAEYAMHLVAMWGQMGSQQSVNLNRLLISEKRDHSETHRIARLVALILRLFHGSRNQ